MILYLLLTNVLQDALVMLSCGKAQCTATSISGSDQCRMRCLPTLYSIVYNYGNVGVPMLFTSIARP